MLFLATNHYGDVRNTSLLQLANLPLYQHFAFDFKQPFRLFIRNGGKTGRKARRHNDGIFDFVGSKSVHALFSYGISIYQTPFRQRLQNLIHRS